MNIRRDLIDTKKFAELFLESGLVLCSDICWLPAYGMTASLCERVPNRVNPAQLFRGLYDLGHLVQIMQGRNGLPDDLAEFFKELDTYFPKRHIFLVEGGLDGPMPGGTASSVASGSASGSASASGDAAGA